MTSLKFILVHLCAVEEPCTSHDLPPGNYSSRRRRENRKSAIDFLHFESLFSQSYVNVSTTFSFFIKKKKYLGFCGKPALFQLYNILFFMFHDLCLAKREVAWRELTLTGKPDGWPGFESFLRRAVPCRLRRTASAWKPHLSRMTWKEPDGWWQYSGCLSKISTAIFWHRLKCESMSKLTHSSHKLTHSKKHHAALALRSRHEQKSVPWHNIMCPLVYYVVFVIV